LTTCSPRRRHPFQSAVWSPCDSVSEIIKGSLFLLRYIAAMADTVHDGQNLSVAIGRHNKIKSPQVASLPGTTSTLPISDFECVQQSREKPTKTEAGRKTYAHCGALEMSLVVFHFTDLPFGVPSNQQPPTFQNCWPLIFVKLTVGQTVPQELT
jgi:hypothetical protein